MADNGDPFRSFETPQAHIENLNIDKKRAAELARIVRQELKVATTGLFLGAIAALLGSLLCVVEIPGSTDGTFSVFGLSLSVKSAIPGVLFMLVGLLIVWITRFKVTLKKLRGAGATLLAIDVGDGAHHYQMRALWLSGVLLILGAAVAIVGVASAADIAIALPEAFGTQAQLTAAPPGVAAALVAVLIAAFARPTRAIIGAENGKDVERGAS
jgi:hypothetical protein